MENDSFIDLPTQNVIFLSFVQLPNGKTKNEATHSLSLVILSTSLSLVITLIRGTSVYFQWCGTTCVVPNQAFCCIGIDPTWPSCRDVPKWIIGFDKSQPELARAKFQFVIKLFLFLGGGVIANSFQHEDR